MERSYISLLVSWGELTQWTQIMTRQEGSNPY
jgi:hypothetical protein